MGNVLFVVAGSVIGLISLVLSDLGSKAIKLFPCIPMVIRIPMDCSSIILGMFVVSELLGNNNNSYLGWVFLLFAAIMILLALLYLAWLKTRKGKYYVNR